LLPKKFAPNIQQSVRKCKKKIHFLVIKKKAVYRYAEKQKSFLKLAWWPK